MTKNFKTRTEDGDFERQSRKPRRESQTDGHRPGEACRVNLPVRCEYCLDSGWLIRVSLPHLQGHIRPSEDHKVPSNMRTYEPCICDAGQDKIQFHS